MEFDPMQFILQGAVSLLSSLLGVTLWAWFSGIYKAKGELTGRAEMLDTIVSEVKATAKATELSTIDARTKRIDDIVKEVAESTKATEGAKIETRLEKLDQILSEVGAVTETQQRIEASVSRGEWNRQWRLQQRRDAYGRVLAALFGLSDYYRVLLNIYTKREQGGSVTEEDNLRAEEVLQKYLTEFRAAQALIRIFAGDRANKALDIYFQRELERWEMDRNSIPYVRQGIKNIDELQAEWTLAGKEDLAVSPTIDKSQ